MNLGECYPASVGPQEYPGQDVTENQGLPQSLHQEAGEKGGYDQDNDFSCNAHIFIRGVSILRSRPGYDGTSTSFIV